MTCSSFCAAGLLTFGALWISGPAEAQVKSTIVIAPTEWETEPADWFGDAEQEAFEAQKERTYSDESTKHVIKDLVAEAVKVMDGKVREYGWRSTVKGDMVRFDEARKRSASPARQKVLAASR